MICHPSYPRGWTDRGEVAERAHGLLYMNMTFTIPFFLVMGSWGGHDSSFLGRRDRGMANLVIIFGSRKPRDGFHDFGGSCYPGSMIS